MKTKINERKFELKIIVVLALLVLTLTDWTIVLAWLVLFFVIKFLGRKRVVIKMLASVGLPADQLLIDYGYNLETYDELSQFAIFYRENPLATEILHLQQVRTKNTRKGLAQLGGVYPELAIFTPIGQLVQNLKTQTKNTPKQTNSSTSTVSSKKPSYTALATVINQVAEQQVNTDSPFQPELSNPANEQMKRNSERLKQQQADIKKRLEAQSIRK